MGFPACNFHLSSSIKSCTNVPFSGRIILVSFIFCDMGPQTLQSADKRLNGALDLQVIVHQRGGMSLASHDFSYPKLASSRRVLVLNSPVRWKEKINQITATADADSCSVLQTNQGLQTANGANGQRDQLRLQNDKHALFTRKVQLFLARKKESASMHSFLIEFASLQFLLARLMIRQPIGMPALGN